jgi:hypothetical protein
MLPSHQSGSSFAAVLAKASSATGAVSPEATVAFILRMAMGIEQT